MIHFIEPWLINSSVGQSAVRNHGSGIAQGIRYELRRNFDYRLFFNALQDKRGSGAYISFLDELTERLENKWGRDENDRKLDARISWGAARKCINLLARAAVYNIHMSNYYKISMDSFCKDGYMPRLELPLDSFAITGLRKDCSKLPASIRKTVDQSIFKKFSIIRLRPDRSSQLQNLAQKIVETNLRPEASGCRVNLDVIYWRGA